MWHNSEGSGAGVVKTLAPHGEGPGDGVVKTPAAHGEGPATVW